MRFPETPERIGSMAGLQTIIAAKNPVSDERTKFERNGAFEFDS